MIDSATRAQVIARAANRWEYCRLDQQYYEATFHAEHIVATQRRADDGLHNLAWCCPRCNRKKGPNLSAIDALTGQVVRLSHPRLDFWQEHFRWDGPILVGLTPTGRATVALLDLNSGERVRLRQSLIAEGVFPPA